MATPNPYNYPCFVLKEILNYDNVIYRNRETFSDLQEAYIWANSDTGERFDPDIREGIKGKWTFVSFRQLVDWMEDDPESGYLIFKKQMDATSRVEYIIYYDIPENTINQSYTQPGQPEQNRN